MERTKQVEDMNSGDLTKSSVCVRIPGTHPPCVNYHTAPRLVGTTLTGSGKTDLVRWLGTDRAFKNQTPLKHYTNDNYYEDHL